MIFLLKPAVIPGCRAAANPESRRRISFALAKISLSSPGLTGRSSNHRTLRHIDGAGVTVGVDGPRRHQCARMRSLDLKRGSRPWARLSALASTRPRVFLCCTVWMMGSRRFCARSFGGGMWPSFWRSSSRRGSVSRRAGRRIIGGRTIAELGHEVVLLPPQLVKPYVARNKNDRADAEAICEAMSRPRMRFVPVKTADRQAAQMLIGLRARLVRQRTQLTNAIR